MLKLGRIKKLRSDLVQFMRERVDFHATDKLVRYPRSSSKVK